MSEESDAKSLRIFFLCAVIVILGGFFFAYKVNACADKPARLEQCKDELFLIDNDHPAHQCSPGARAELVTSPPAPKPGIICHCPQEAQSPAHRQEP